MTLGQYIREARERKQITLRALAAACKLSAPFLSDVEHDRRTPKDLDVIALALGVPADELHALDPRRAAQSDVEDLKRRVAALEARMARLDWKA